MSPTPAALYPRGWRSAARALVAATTLSLVLIGCDDRAAVEAPVEVVRPVRTLTIEAPQAPPPMTFTGVVEAQDRVALAFRISGRLAERLVGVGAEVREGDVIARLDPENELNALRSAQASLSSAQGTLRKAANQYQRQRQLFDRGVTSQADLEAAEQANRAAAAQVDAAAARLRTAELTVGFTKLEADADGVVTAVGAEPGEFVAPGRAIVQVARREGRDAVFELPATALPFAPVNARMTVSVPGAAGGGATGLVREVDPTADPVTRTFTVRVGLSNPAATFRLGTTVTGQITAEASDAIRLPATAIKQDGGTASVWIVDPQTNTVAARKVELVDADPATALVGAGLKPGDVVVTAGVGLLKEGQAVRLLGADL
jgi:RND family efflux transporter MFP subunit